MRTISTTLYSFSELSDAAKQKAIANFRAEGLDDQWYDSVFEDAKTIAGLMGIEIDDIFFSGFASQGDGASFTGRYEFAEDSVNAVKQHAPLDTKLHEIAEALVAVQAKVSNSLRSRISTKGRYSHSGTMDFDFSFADEDTVSPDLFNEVEETLKSSLRGFADWIYKQLETDYDALNEDEAIIERIVDQEAEFCDDGSIYSA